MAALCGISPKDSLMMPPGEIFDTFELWKEAHTARPPTSV